MSNKTKYLYLVDDIPSAYDLKATDKPYVYATNDGNVQFHWKFKQPMDYVEVAGVKWMKCNLGASSEIEYGLYYPWGGTVGYTDVSECKFSESDPLSNMLYGKSEDELKEMGAIDYNGNLTPKYDAVTNALGNGWRMPTKDEFQSLIDNTKVNITAGGIILYINGHNDYLFFPFSGLCYNASVDYINSYGAVWGSSVSPSDADSANLISFNPLTLINIFGTRYFGFPVRGVKTT